MAFAPSTAVMARAAQSQLLPLTPWQHRAQTLTMQLRRSAPERERFPSLSGHRPPYRLAALQPSASGGDQGSAPQPAQDQPHEETERTTSAAERCQMAFGAWLFSAALAAALFCSRSRLEWLFTDAPRLSTSAWQRLFKQQLLPVFGAYYAQLWGKPQKVAAAAAAEAAAAHAKNISYKDVMFAVLTILTTIVFLFFKSVGDLLWELQELLRSKRSE